MTRPLDGKRVVVTRPAGQASGLVERLATRGAEVTSVPLIRTEPIVRDPAIDRVLGQLAEYAFVVVTSANGADCFANALEARRAALPAGVAVVAVGDATAARLRERGLDVDAIPPRATGAAIVADVSRRSLEGARVLLPRAREGRPELPEGLRAAGALVDDVAFYDTVAVAPDAAGVALLRDADAVVVTSPSAVRALVGVLGGAAPPVVSIGPTTTEAAVAMGLTVVDEAADQSVDGLAEAVVRALGPGQPPS